MSAWTNRSLTMLGKIQVVNTLVAPLTVLKFTVLPNPEDCFFTKANEHITRFLWNNKRPKIAHKMLIQSIPNGGLKLCDLKIKCNALKVSWVKKCTYKRPYLWKMIANDVLPIRIPSIFECNIAPKDVKHLNIEIRIWRDILSAWAYVNYNKVENCSMYIRNQILWLNSDMNF